LAVVLVQEAKGLEQVNTLSIRNTGTRGLLEPGEQLLLDPSVDILAEGREMGLSGSLVCSLG
jgi:hypothetical protein